MNHDQWKSAFARQRASRRLSGDPTVIRARLAAYPRGPWCVYETLAADGTKAIGISPVPPARSAAMIVYDGLAEDVAELAATGLAEWYEMGGAR